MGKGAFSEYNIENTRKRALTKSCNRLLVYRQQEKTSPAPELSNLERDIVILLVDYALKCVAKSSVEAKDTLSPLAIRSRASLIACMSSGVYSSLFAEPPL